MPAGVGGCPRSTPPPPNRLCCGGGLLSETSVPKTEAGAGKYARRIANHRTSKPPHLWHAISPLDRWDPLAVTSAHSHKNWTYLCLPFFTQNYAVDSPQPPQVRHSQKKESAVRGAAMRGKFHFRGPVCDYYIY